MKFYSRSENSKAAVHFYHLLGTQLQHCAPGQTEKRPSIVTLLASPVGVVQQKCETTVGSLLIIGRFLHLWSVVGVCGPFRCWVNQQVCYGSGGKLNKQAEDCTVGYGLNQRFLQGKGEHSSGHCNDVTSWAFHEIQPYGCIIIWKGEETWGTVATASDSS